VFKSKEHRDEVNKKVMEEMSEKYKDAKGFSGDKKSNRRA
jgi:hypothetical protein